MRRMAPRRRMREAKLKMGPVVPDERNPFLARGGVRTGYCHSVSGLSSARAALARQCQHIYEAIDRVALVT